MSVTEPNEHKITEEDLATVWPCALSYLAEILNGEYSVEDARADALSLIGSKYDRRRALPSGEQS